MPALLLKAVVALVSGDGFASGVYIHKLEATLDCVEPQSTLVAHLHRKP